MAELSAGDRQRISRALMRYWSQLNETFGALSKADLLAAVNATDAWIDDNQSGFNTALPTAARTELTADQKTLLFCAVALMRIDPGVAAFLKHMFGEVD